MKQLSKFAILASTVLLGACNSHLYNTLPRRAAAYRVIPEVASPQEQREANLIIPGDELALTVVSEPDLSIEKLVVDTNGVIVVPLIGELEVAGHSPGEASHLIEEKLGEKFLKSPHVALNVTTAAPRNVSVEGQVTKAGVYPVTPDTTLMSAVAMAESTSKNARLDEVVIFRMRNNTRLAARFDLDRIRAGVDPDPQILPGDTVVVGFSYGKSAYHDLLTAAPFFNIFTRF